MNEWLLLQEGAIIYIALFLLLMGGAIGLPIPEDLPILLAGVLAHAGKGDIALLMLTCYVAVISGDTLIFFIGRYFGATIFKKQWFRSRVSASKVRDIRRRLERRRFLTILIARHLFYLRTVTFLICGAVRMRFSLFIIADLAAALVSVPIVFGIGYFAAGHIDAVLSGFEKAKSWSIIVGVIAALVILMILIRRHRRGLRELAQNGDVSELSPPEIPGCSKTSEPPPGR